MMSSVFLCLPICSVWSTLGPKESIVVFKLTVFVFRSGFFKCHFSDKNYFLLSINQFQTSSNSPTEKKSSLKAEFYLNFPTVSICYFF
jgi:hypothetical protein